MRRAASRFVGGRSSALVTISTRLGPSGASAASRTLSTCACLGESPSRHAEAPRQLAEIRVAVQGTVHVALPLHLLPKRQDPVGIVIDDENAHGDLLAHGGLQILDGHHEISVAENGHHLALRMHQLGGQRCRKTKAHRSKIDSREKGQGPRAGMYAIGYRRCSPAPTVITASSERRAARRSHT